VYQTRLLTDDTHSAGEKALSLLSDRMAVSRGHTVARDIKPSIAVLPFQNLSGGVDQEYFADGITEDIITALSHVRWLFVVARNSTFAYKNRTPDVREVGRDLGARYVLEGSVRKAGNRVRVSAQLIDAGTGNHVWAGRYDRVLEDIFDLQEEIAETIAARIEPELGYAERDRAQSRATEDLGAWDLYQRAMWHLYRFTREDADRARALFRAAIDRDPRFPCPYTGLAYQQLYDVMNGYSADFEESLAASERNVRRALALDDKDALARFTLGRLYTLKGEYETAMQEFELGATLNPGFAQIYHGMGFALAFGGRPEDSIPYFEKAIRLSPHDPHLTSFMAVRAYAYLTLHKYDQATESADGAIRQPNAMEWPHIFRTSALGHLSSPRAEASLRELLAHTPCLTCERVRQLLYYVRWREDLDHCIEGLAKAGLPP
jgi:adenylate cyclase